MLQVFVKNCIKNVKKDIKQCFISISGGGRGVRTLAPVARPNSLANCPLHHLGIPPKCFLKNEYCKTILLINVGGEGGIRTHGTLQTHANFQDWCHKPTRPPLRVALTIFILPHKTSICQYLFYIFFNFCITLHLNLLHKLIIFLNLHN